VSEGGSGLGAVWQAGDCEGNGKHFSEEEFGGAARSIIFRKHNEGGAGLSRSFILNFSMRFPSWKRIPGWQLSSSKEKEQRCAKGAW